MFINQMKKILKHNETCQRHHMLRGILSKIKNYISDFFPEKQKQDQEQKQKQKQDQEQKQKQKQDQEQEQKQKQKQFYNAVVYYDAYRAAVHDEILQKSIKEERRRSLEKSRLDMVSCLPKIKSDIIASIRSGEVTTGRHIYTALCIDCNITADNVDILKKFLIDELTAVPFLVVVNTTNKNLFMSRKYYHHKPGIQFTVYDLVT